MSSRKSRKAIGGHMEVLLGSAAPTSDLATPPAARGSRRGRAAASTRRQRRATYHLPEDLVRKVDALCRAQGLARGATVAKALEAYIQRWEAEAKGDVLRFYRGLLAVSGRAS